MLKNHRAVGFYERPEELPGGAEESVVAPKSQAWAIWRGLPHCGAQSLK